MQVFELWEEADEAGEKPKKTQGGYRICEKKTPRAKNRGHNLKSDNQGIVFIKMTKQMISIQQLA